MIGSTGDAVDAATPAYAATGAGPLLIGMGAPHRAPPSRPGVLPAGPNPESLPPKYDRAVAVIISCPVCEAQVRLLPDASVEAHQNAAGAACSFTRTAGSGWAPKQVFTREELERAAERQAMLKAKKDALRVMAEEGRQRKREATARPKAPVPEKTACPKCGRSVRPTRAGALPAHTPSKRSRRWCPGGLEPTQKQKDSLYEGGSIRTVSGGLPGLGRRR